MPPNEKFPELVLQRAHGPGAHEEHSFEDALRNLVRNSPYLGISLLLHLAVLGIFFSMKLAPAVVEDHNKIVATPDEIEEPIPPEPEEEPEIEEIEEVIEEPVLTEDVVTDVSEIVDVPSDAPFENTGANDVVGVGGGGGGFGGRGKLGTRGKAAGSPHQRTIDDALRWLKFHQSVDGNWSANGFEDECGQIGDGYCTGRGSVMHDVGVTGLSLLAFLGAGNTDKDGKYRTTVKAGLKYLIEGQGRDGNYGDDTVSAHTYDHFIATLAVMEAYALTQKFSYKKSARKALEYIYELRNPGAAWRYGDRSSDDMVAHANDVSVTGWAVMVLSLAHEYDIDVDEVAFEDSILFIEEMTDSTGRTGYYEPGQNSSRIEGVGDTWPDTETEAMTAVGILCRIFADPDLEREGNEAAIEAGVQLILDKPIVFNPDGDIGKIDYYYWYYATYALYQWGGSSWKAWEKNIKQVADHQRGEEDGDMHGSWDPQLDPWGGLGGRVYSTAILALLMEVYYRYDNVMGSH